MTWAQGLLQRSSSSSPEPFETPRNLSQQEEPQPGLGSERIPWKEMEQLRDQAGDGKVVRAQGLPGTDIPVNQGTVLQGKGTNVKINPLLNPK